MLRNAVSAIALATVAGQAVPATITSCGGVRSRLNSCRAAVPPRAGRGWAGRPQRDAWWPQRLTPHPPAPQSVSWSSLTVTPPSPQAGDTVIVNGTGTASVGITGGTGEIDAYLFGLNVFETTVNTCGQNQTIDVLDMATGTFNALACPVAAGAPAAMSFSLAIPDIANGLGALNIIMNATDSGKKAAFCVNMSVTL